MPITKPHRRKKRGNVPKMKPIPSADRILAYADPEIPVNARGVEPTGAGSLPVGIENVLRYIAVNQGVNTTGLCKFFEKSVKVVFRHLTELRYRNFVEFCGSPRDGGYFLLPAGLAFLQNPESDPAFNPQPMTAGLVYNFIAEHPGANHYALAAHFHRTVKAVNRHTIRLRRKKKISFRGKPQTGGFYVRVPRKKNVPAGATETPLSEVVTNDK